jgi:ATP-binding cassette subfamily B (MDR/TAP) protein 1
MNLKVNRGNKVAFVGTSGCGKSTIIQLLQRFYFPESGRITINGIDIKDFEIHYLRSRFGVVSQEPVLFNGTFADNIRYNQSDASQQQIEDAAIKANAISFIMGNEQTNLNNGEDRDGQTGFNKNVGVKGSHISGGQKQRVAIARTILRNPGMLLLDEATSALDRAN